LPDSQQGKPEEEEDAEHDEVVGEALAQKSIGEVHAGKAGDDEHGGDGAEGNQHAQGVNQGVQQHFGDVLLRLVDHAHGADGEDRQHAGGEVKHNPAQDRHQHVKEDAARAGLTVCGFFSLGGRLRPRGGFLPAGLFFQAFLIYRGGGAGGVPGENLQAELAAFLGRHSAESGGLVAEVVAKGRIDSYFARLGIGLHGEGQAEGHAVVVNPEAIGGYLGRLGVAQLAKTESGAVSAEEEIGRFPLGGVVGLLHGIREGDRGAQHSLVSRFKLGGAHRKAQGLPGGGRQNQEQQGAKQSMFDS